MNENEVHISADNCSKLGVMCDWLVENDIKDVRIITKHSENAFGRALIYGFTFKFQTKEDSMAFKLRWL